ncbi:MAG: PBP1A family penicillin-binding protein [Rhizobiales bacterium]|nr:PBP1A family penicillin-binding protein [Hyphomicrobiales bacterium]
MGPFSKRKKSSKGRGRRPRVEPRLFAGEERSRAAPRQPARPRRGIKSFILGWTLKLGLAGTLMLALLFGYIWFSLDQKGLLKIPDREPGVMVLAADGTRLAEQGSFFGDDVRLAELPDYVPNAIIAIEDRRFYLHYGVDPIGLTRAIVTNFRSGRLVQGGSTLTQQLAKNLFLTPERTLERKLQEVVLAVWLETRYSKAEILQLYLNRVYFGGGAVGIEKAAEAYYRKPARELTIAEAATLAGLLKAPTSYSPVLHPEAAAERMRLVLNSMVDTGAITPEEAQNAIDAPAAVVASDYVPATQYILDWVSEQLPDLVKDNSQSIVVETTIDPALQANAEKSLRKRLNTEGAKLGASQGAFVALDTSGAIKAMVGGKSYRRSQFNRVSKAKRQPGSAFKPFLYLAALEKGFTPDSVEVDGPVTIGGWSPENYKQKYLGPVTLRTALAMSLNTVAVRLIAKVGPAAVAGVARRLGIVSALGQDDSLALGTSVVTPLELTSAFVPFANGGRPVVPYAITRITARDGRVLYQRSGSGFDTAIAPGDLGDMNDMLRAVVTEGTARKAQFGDFMIAGKNGTSQDYRDAWFIGYTSYLVAGVWVGNDDNSPTLKVTGGLIPAEIWRDAMEPAHAGLVPEPLPGGATRYSNVTQLPGEDGRSVSPSQESGFFEDLGNLFRSSGADDGQGNSPTAFQRMKQPRDK